MRESGAAFRWIRAVGLSILALFAAVPLLIAVRTSATPLADLQQPFSWVPHHVTFRAYVDMWSAVPLGHYLANSVVVSTSVTTFALVLALPAGYALARSKECATGALGLVLLATQAAPGLLFLLPLVLVYAKITDITGIDLVGTYPGLILTDLTFALPATIWILTVYISTLPTDVEDAARLDGAGSGRVLASIVAPQAIPGLLTAALFSFLTAWSEVLFATVLTDADTETIPVGLHGFAAEAVVYWNQLTAAALTTSLPVVVAFIALERLVAKSMRQRRHQRSSPYSRPRAMASARDSTSSLR
jgi:multiple sugar transport system permease protein